MKKPGKHKSKLATVIKWFGSVSILAVLLWFVYIYAGKLLCHIALGQLGEMTNTKISAGSIKYQADGSVVINDLAVQPLKSQNGHSDIIRAKKLYASFNKGSLFLLKPRLDSIDVNDFIFSAIYDVNTGWSNLSDLKIKAHGGSFDNAPNIKLDSGTLQYVKIIDGKEEVALSVPVDADFVSVEDPNRKYNFNITTATMSSGYGLSRLQGSWEPGSVIVTGGVASLGVPKYEMAWFINVSAAELKYDRDENYSLALAIKDMRSLRSREPNALNLEIPSFVEKQTFFTSLQKFLDTYKPRGLVDIDLDMSGNLNRFADSIVKGAVNCRDIAFTYPGSEFLIEHLAGKIDFSQNGISFDSLKGKHGDSELVFKGFYKNFGPDHEYKVDISSDKMPLENDLYSILDTKRQKFWSVFSPAGNVAIDLEIKKDPKAKKDVNLNLRLLDVDASYSNFPYPLKHLTGRLVFNYDKIMALDVLSQDNDIEIAINGEILNHPINENKYKFSIDVNNVPLDSTLEAAFQKNQKKLYQKFQPSGLAKGIIQVSGPESGDMNYVADLNFKNTSIKTDFLSQRVSDISTHAVFSPDLMIIREFSGQYGDIPVSLSGRIMPDHEQRLGYDVSLNLNKVQLDNKELHSLLPESFKKTMERYDPNGEVDLVVDLKKENPAVPADYSVIVNCLGNNMKPADFPYPVTNITGIMNIDSDRIVMKGVSAFLGENAPDEPNRPKIALNGDIQLKDGLLNQTGLELSASNILMDERFGRLLPQFSRDLYKTLSPAGSIDIDFKNLRILNDGGKNTIDFDGAIGLGKCDFILSNKPAKLDSVIKVQGKYKSGGGFSSCKVVVDNGTLNLLGRTLTAFKTEINYDPNLQHWSSDYLLADLYGGRTTGKIEFIQKDGAPMEYILQTAFENVDLEKFISSAKTAETKDSKDTTYISGKMNGSMSLSSHVPQNNSRIGLCRVTIENMQVGKLSPIAKLLQVLNLNEPSDYAFDSIFIDSYIRRNGLVVEKLDMSGKSVAFYGSGSISLLNGELDLSLTARGRRLATDDPSVFQSLTEGLGKAVVRMDVTGDFSNIKIVTKALPVIEGTLEILGTKPIVEN